MNDPIATPQDPKAYVAAAGGLHRLELNEERLEAVAQQFALLAEMAELLRRVPLPSETEPAPVYRP